MMYNAPTSALVRIPCEHAAAAQLTALGIPVIESDDLPIAEFACAFTSDLYTIAAERCEVDREQGILIADLAANAVRLIDETPSNAEATDRHGHPTVWREPHLEVAKVEPLRLPHVASEVEAHEHVVIWLRQIEPISPDELARSKVKWKQRLSELREIAAAEAERVRVIASETEVVELDRHLGQIAHYITWGTNFESDLELDGHGEAWVPSKEFKVNDHVGKVFELAARIESDVASRDERNRTREEIESLTLQYLDQLSNRLNLAFDADMLEQSIGIARAELLGLLRPGWSWVEFPLKEANNPPEDALEALIASREQLDSDIELAYVAGKDKRYVLTADFLGRKAMAEINLMLPREGELSIESEVTQ